MALEKLKIVRAVRMSEALYKTLLKAAAHDRIDVSELLRYFGRGICRGRRVAQIEIPERITKSGPRIVPVRGLFLPQSCTADEFRRVAAIRAIEDLRVPAMPPPPSEVYQAVCGKDYLVNTEDGNEN